MKDIGKTTVFGIFHRQAMPDGVMPVEEFSLEKYCGRWFEIGRMDFFWEKKSLTNVYAEYTINEEGTVDVKNTGFNEKSGKWSSYEGEARFRADNNIAALEVTFFGGAWAGYNVVSIDKDYKNALVYGRNLDYLWILSRDRSMPQSIKDLFLAIAKETGYDISKINWPSQDKEIED